MVVLFSMLDGAKEVACAISTSAMDELEGKVRAEASQREAQFMRLRTRIEACAAGNGVRGFAARHHPSQHRFSETEIAACP
jgi:uncharacterized protein DUF1488